MGEVDLGLSRIDCFYWRKINLRQKKASTEQGLNLIPWTPLSKLSVKPALALLV